MRKIPDLSKGILFPLIGSEKKNQTESGYLNKIEEFERKCEDSLINTLSRLNIHASVKTDRYSLPYQFEVEKTLYGESYLNGPYEFYRVAREFVKELLVKDVYKIRFYLLIDVDTEKMLGKVTYKFRYYIHN